MRLIIQVALLTTAHLQLKAQKNHVDIPTTGHNSPPSQTKKPGPSPPRSCKPHNHKTCSLTFLCLCCSCPFPARSDQVITESDTNISPSTLRELPTITRYHKVFTIDYSLSCGANSPLPWAHRSHRTLYHNWRQCLEELPGRFRS